MTTTTPPAAAQRDRGSDARGRLLAKAVDHVLAHGLSDLSLRELAAAIGTSHRMLIYHFGSKEELIVAVIRTVEDQQRDAFAALENEELEPADAMRAMWQRFTTPELGPHERLFFEIYGQGLQGRPGAVELLDGIVDAWLEPSMQYLIEHGASPEVARADARLNVAVIRGLLLDWLATNDRTAVDAAFERYVGLQERARDRA